MGTVLCEWMGSATRMQPSASSPLASRPLDPFPYPTPLKLFRITTDMQRAVTVA